jgi:DNA invertase Pin-like site-specific DNA recombinase
MTVPLRAALYLRVSTARQAEHDVSIPDQKRQGEAYCGSRGYQLVETYVGPGASATNDRRPDFQRMIEAGTNKPAPFDIVVVHSFSRFLKWRMGCPPTSNLSGSSPIYGHLETFDIDCIFTLSWPRIVQPHLQSPWG